MENFDQNRQNDPNLGREESFHTDPVDTPSDNIFDNTPKMPDQPPFQDPIRAPRMPRDPYYLDHPLDPFLQSSDREHASGEIGWTPPPFVPQADAVAQESVSGKPHKSKKSKSALIILLSCGGLLLASLIGWLCFRILPAKAAFSDGLSGIRSIAAEDPYLSYLSDATTGGKISASFEGGGVFLGFNSYADSSTGETFTEYLYGTPEEKNSLSLYESTRKIVLSSSTVGAIGLDYATAYDHFAGSVFDYRVSAGMDQKSSELLESLLLHLKKKQTNGETDDKVIEDLLNLFYRNLELYGTIENRMEGGDKTVSIILSSEQICLVLRHFLEDVGQDELLLSVVNEELGLLSLPFGAQDGQSFYDFLVAQAQELNPDGMNGLCLEIKMTVGLLTHRFRSLEAVITTNNEKNSFMLDATDDGLDLYYMRAVGSESVLYRISYEPAKDGFVIRLTESGQLLFTAILRFKEDGEFALTLKEEEDGTSVSIGGTYKKTENVLSFDATSLVAPGIQLGGNSGEDSFCVNLSFCRSAEMPACGTYRDAMRMSMVDFSNFFTQITKPVQDLINRLDK